MSLERESAMEPRRRRKGICKGAWANNEGDRGKREREKKKGRSGGSSEGQEGEKRERTLNDIN
jgi:hypothetical protein